MDNWDSNIENKNIAKEDKSLSLSFLRQLMGLISGRKGGVFNPV